MRARVLLVTGLFVGFAAACAAPADEAPEAPTSEAEPRDLSLLDAPAAASVLSDIEAGDIEPLPARRAQTPISAQQAGEIQAEEPRPAATEPAPYVLATAGTVAAPTVTMPRGRPAVVAEAPAGEMGEGSGSGDGEAESPSAGRGVLIRGGVRVDDDCAAHMGGRTGRGLPAGLGQPTLGAPGPGDVLTPPEPGAATAGPGPVRPPQGALVNDRGPRTGLPRAGQAGGIRF